jgi:very-short-patch-repair endonuclease
MDNKYVCNYCGYVAESGKKLGGHKGSCKLNPIRPLKIEKIKKSSMNRVLSSETKKKISEARKKFIIEHPEMAPYRLNHSSRESWPEKAFREALTRLKISGWTQEYQLGLYSIDFAFIDNLIAVEIDGSTHLLEKVIKKDIERDNFLRSLGWTIIRIPAKLVRDNVYVEIEKLTKYLTIDFKVPDEVREYVLAKYNSQAINKQKEFNKLQKIKNKNNELVENISKVKNLDRSKFGWVKDAAAILKIEPQSVNRWMKKHCPEILASSFNRKV